MGAGGDTRWRGEVTVAAVAVLVCAAMGLLGQPDWWWSATMAVTLALRRTRPVVFATLATAVSAVHLVVDAALLMPGDVVLLVAVFSVAVHGSERARNIGLFLGLFYAIGLGAGAVFASLSSGAEGAALVVGLVSISMVTAWALGILERRKTEALREARHRRMLSERDAGARTRLAAFEERARISGEMHDVLAHTLTSIVVQAESGQATAPSGDAAKVFATISATSRSALREVRGLLSPEGELETHPKPGIDDLERLIESFARSGLYVDLQVAGQPRSLSVGMSLAVYRVIQESVTNALRHGSGGPVLLRLTWGEAMLSVSASNPMTLDTAAQPIQEHRGLEGIRRRCTLYGGSVRYSWAEDFVLTATWPLNAVESGRNA